jgi:FkbM family methyltransferase
MFRSTIRVCNHSFLPQLIDSNAIVVDLGAFDGDFAQVIIEQFHCRVFSAEPVREIFDRIPPDPLLKVLPVAVGGKDQSITMNVFTSRCASILGTISPGEAAEGRQVEMITLSEFCRRAEVGHINLLKFDIEGAEIQLRQRPGSAERHTDHGRISRLYLSRAGSGSLANPRANE